MGAQVVQDKTRHCVAINALGMLIASLYNSGLIRSPHEVLPELRQQKTIDAYDIGSLVMERCKIGDGSEVWAINLRHWVTLRWIQCSKPNQSGKQFFDLRITCGKCPRSAQRAHDLDSVLTEEGYRVVRNANW